MHRGRSTSEKAVKSRLVPGVGHHNAILGTGERRERSVAAVEVERLRIAQLATRRVRAGP